MKSVTLTASKIDPILAGTLRPEKKLQRPGTYVASLGNMAPPVTVPGVSLGNLIPTPINSKPPKAKGFK